jgi:hypothetical protein
MKKIYGDIVVKSFWQNSTGINLYGWIFSSSHGGRQPCGKVRTPEEQIHCRLNHDVSPCFFLVQ